MPYSTRQYGSNQRWMLKALREVAGELESLLTSFRDDELRWRPDDDRWSAYDIAAFLRASEIEDVRAVQAMLGRDGVAIAERRAHLVPGEPAGREEPVHELFWDFATQREELVWLLQFAEESWEHRGMHPYRGPISLTQYVHEINERDLDASWQLRELREALPRTPV